MAPLRGVLRSSLFSNITTFFLEPLRHHGPHSYYDFFTYSYDQGHVPGSSGAWRHVVHEAERRPS